MDTVGKFFWIAMFALLVASLGRGPTREVEVARVALLAMVVVGAAFFKYKHRAGKKMRFLVLNLEFSLVATIVATGLVSSNAHITILGVAILALFLFAGVEIYLRRRDEGVL